MTRLLEQVLTQASKLSPAQQDALAARWLDELSDDARWDAAFANSQSELSKLASHVREQIRTGKVESAGIDEL